MVTGAEWFALVKGVGPVLVAKASNLLESKAARDARERKSVLAQEIGDVIYKAILAGGSVTDRTIEDLIEKFHELVSDGAKPANLKDVELLIRKSGLAVRSGDVMFSRGPALSTSRDSEHPVIGAGRAPRTRNSAAGKYMSAKPPAKVPKALPRPPKSSMARTIAKGKPVKASPKSTSVRVKPSLKSAKAVSKVK